MPSIRLNKQTKTIKVVNRQNKIRLTQLDKNLILKQAGVRGPAGKGLPAGGSLGQVPYKKSDADYDIEWRQPSLADKTFLQYFTATDSLQINHKLNKYPAVVVMDSAGELVEAAINYIDVDNIAVNFMFPTSGTISCN